MSEVVADPDRHLPLWTPIVRGQEPAWEEVFEGYVAQVDFPGAAFWPEISAAFPDALVVLSTRPAGCWYNSAVSTIFRLTEDPIFSDIWRERFGFERYDARFSDPEAMIAAYERHNAKVRSSVPPRRFLEWTPADGWAPICNRLGTPVPNEPFPWVNTSAEFQADNDLN
jgi:hypothetical protein